MLYCMLNLRILIAIRIFHFFHTSTVRASPTVFDTFVGRTTKTRERPWRGLGMQIIVQCRFVQHNRLYVIALVEQPPCRTLSSYFLIPISYFGHNCHCFVKL